MKKLNYVFIIICIITLSGCNPMKEPVDYVNPMLGTSGNRWMLLHGPCLPFGMVKLSPDNTDNYALDAGYEYKYNSISGFGHGPF